MLLFQFNLGTQALDLCLQSLGLVLGSTLLEGSGSLVNKVLSVLQTQAEELFHLLDQGPAATATAAAAGSMPYSSFKI